MKGVPPERQTERLHNSKPLRLEVALILVLQLKAGALSSFRIPIKSTVKFHFNSEGISRSLSRFGTSNLWKVGRLSLSFNREFANWNQHIWYPVPHGHRISQQKHMNLCPQKDNSHKLAKFLRNRWRIIDWRKAGFLPVLLPGLADKTHNESNPSNNSEKV